MFVQTLAEFVSEFNAGGPRYH